MWYLTSSSPFPGRHKYFMGPETLPSTCYILSDEYNILSHNKRGSCSRVPQLLAQTLDIDTLIFKNGSYNQMSNFKFLSSKI